MLRRGLEVVGLIIIIIIIIIINILQKCVETPVAVSVLSAEVL